MPNTLLTFDQACPHFHQALQPSATVTLPLSQAVHRVLAKPIPMPRPQPPFDRATMDGYAVAPHPDQPAGPYAVQGTLPAGDATDWELHPGQAVRIMTGARAPAGTAVIPIEVCEVTDRSGDTVVTVPENLAFIGKNVAKTGEDAEGNAPIGHPGASIDSALIAALAMTGTDAVTVFEPPHVSLVTTGDEVGGSGAASIANTNGPLLLGACAGWQLPTTYQHCADNQRPSAN